MLRINVSRRLTIAVVVALVMQIMSFIPSSWNIPFVIRHQAFAGTVPTLNLPWRVGDKDVNGNPIYFSVGPHGAPVVFPCSGGNFLYR